MSAYVFDIETDGLLGEGLHIHCISTLEVQNPEEIHHYHTSSEVEEAIIILQEADRIIGHNICGFDIPFIETSYGYLFDLAKCVDTYIISKMLFPNRPSHSLGSYGEQFGIPKPEHEDWSEYSEEMKHRNIEDVKINYKTYEFLKSKARGWDWSRASVLENQMHYWQAMQELIGVDFNSELARKLLERIDKEVDEIDERLMRELPKRIVSKGAAVNLPFKKDGSYRKATEDWFNEDAESIGLDPEE